MTESITRQTSLNVYVGTYARGDGKGIYLLHFDPETVAFDRPELVAETSNPSFLALHPRRPLLYAVIESADSREKPGVAAFSIEPASGKLTLLNQQPSGGSGPCHLSVDDSGRNVLVANYNSGSIAVLPIAEDGRLKKASCFIQHHGRGVDPQRQEGPHAHQICLDPANRFVFVPDLGLDKVFIYRFDAGAGMLAAQQPPAAELSPGSGPRVIAFDPTARFAYVLNEMAATLTAFAYDADRGELHPLPQTLSTLPDGYTGPRGAAQVTVHPTGRFVHASNRGHDSIAVYSRDAASGRLAYLGETMTGGKTPRHFAIAPDGRYLIAANQDSSNLTALRIDSNTGKLTPVGPAVSVPMPVCILFAPAFKK